MSYVLRRHEPLANGCPAYVAPPGSAKSYTGSLARARRFPTHAAALADACGNESPMNA